MGRNNRIVDGQPAHPILPNDIRSPEALAPLPEELTVAPEVAIPPEPDVPSALPPLGDEFNAVQQQETFSSERRQTATPQALHRRTLLLQAAAVITAVVITNNALGIDILYHDPLIHDIYSHYHEYYDEYYDDYYDEDPWDTVEEADYYFPSLPNLEPNGEVPGIGVLDQEFIRFESGEANTQQWLYAGSAYGWQDENGNFLPVETEWIEGAEYDRNTNVLTLTDFNGPCLNVNMMGNGFTVKLVGENHLDAVLVWGYSYGGSIKFTGDGSLTVNESLQYDVGILLRAEYSQSAVMVDSGVKLNVYGKEAALFVEDTLDQKGLYYLYPLTMTGGKRYTEISMVSADPPASNAGVINENGTDVLHLTIS
ncbi:MAG: hypothetical protein J5874_05010 [Oscillospiraceae bacterium]|nr:hypothetical protein [Oscillospiraceae bacterium]